MEKKKNDKNKKIEYNMKSNFLRKKENFNK